MPGLADRRAAAQRPPFFPVENKCFPPPQRVSEISRPGWGIPHQSDPSSCDILIHLTGARRPDPATEPACSPDLSPQSAVKERLRAW